MKKRIVSIITTLCLVVGLCSVLGIQADAYSTGHPNTHVNTGDQRSDVIMIAETQLGYAEDPGTKYGAWWGEKNGVGDNFVNSPWCVMFAHWCMDQAGCTAGYSGCSAESSSLLSQYISGKNGNTAYQFGSGYMPRPGDLIFVGSSSGGTSYINHVGIVTSVSGDTIYTIEGNYSNNVSRSSYSLSTGYRSGSAIRHIVYFGVPAYTNDATPDFTGPVVTPEAPEQTPDTGINYKTKTTTGLNVRTEPSTTAPVLSSLYAGQEVTIVDEADGNNGYKWGKLSTGGWICLFYTTQGSEYTGTPTTPDVSFTAYDGTVNCNVLNVRSSAGTSASITDTLYYGDSVTITDEATANNLEWGQLSTGGWVAIKYITKTETPEEIPPEEIPDETPEETPEETPDETPDTTPDETPDETPEEAPETKPTSINGTITASMLNIREAPGNGTVIGAYYRGDSVEITELQELSGKDWGKTNKGWISMSYVEIAAAETPSTPETPETPSTGTACTVTGTVVNVRYGAGTGYGVISSVTKGQTVTITETATVNGSLWGRMTSGGWICLQYTNYSGGSSSIPETPETPEAPETTPGTPANITGTITASVLNVRATPGTGSVVSAYYRGQTVQVTETQVVDGATWGKTSAGWISMAYVQTKASAGGSTVSGTTRTITGSVVNVRSGAGTSNAVISTVTKGQTVTIVATAYDSNGKNWGQLSSGGWISMDYAA